MRYVATMYAVRTTLPSFLYRRSTMMAVFWILVTMYCICSMVQSDLFKEEGIMVHKRTEARVINGFWTLIVHVEHVEEPPNLQVMVERVAKVITELPRQPRSSLLEMNVGREDGVLWLMRLQGIKKALQQNNMATRQRRGILDGLYKTFGIGSDHDVQLIRKIVQENKENIDILHHNAQMLLSVLKKKVTVEDDHMEMIEASVTAVENKLNVVVNRTVDTEIAVELMGQIRLIDLTILDLERQVDQYRDLLRMFHQKVMDIDKGVLTRDILPENHLLETLSQIRELHLGTLEDYHWYYASLSVRYIGEDGLGGLLYSVTIPTVSSEGYLHYNIETFDMPLADNHIKRLIIDKEIIVNTENGNSFTPHHSDCIGVNPVVCRPGIINLQNTCASKLITGSIVPSCKFHISGRENRTIDFYRPDITSNMIVVVAYVSTEVTHRCLGSTAVTEIIFGPKMFNLSPECSIESLIFKVSAIKAETRNVTLISPEYIPLPAMNLTWPQILPDHMLETLNMTKFTEIQLSDVPEMLMPIHHRVHVGNFTFNHTETIIILVIIALLTLAFLILFTYCSIKFLSKRKYQFKSAPVHDALEMTTLTQPPTETIDSQSKPSAPEMLNEPDTSNKNVPVRYGQIFPSTYPTA